MAGYTRLPLMAVLDSACYVSTKTFSMTLKNDFERRKGLKGLLDQLCTATSKDASRDASFFQENLLQSIMILSSAIQRLPGVLRCKLRCKFLPRTFCYNQ